jgi:predicted ATP-binding protein involved in virulence
MTLDRQSVEEKLTGLQKIWKKSRTHRRGRFGFYRYLRAVYNWYAELRTTEGSAKKARDQIIKLHKLSKKLRQNHAINVIIAATSKEDKRTQSRWAQALRYVWKYREQLERLSLADFLTKNGGPAGCAANLSQRIKPKS